MFTQSQITIKAYYWVPWQEIIDMETPSQSQRGHGNPLPKGKEILPNANPPKEGIP